MQAELWDGSGSVPLVWLGRRDIPGIQPGRKMVAQGQDRQVRGQHAIYNPDYELRPSGGEASPEPGPEPVADPWLGQQVPGP